MTKVPLGLRLDQDLLTRLDRWRSQQAVEPGRTAVIEKALREFLDRYSEEARDG